MRRAARAGRVRERSAFAGAGGSATRPGGGRL